jgi:hypothetical protein
MSGRVSYRSPAAFTLRSGGLLQHSFLRVNCEACPGSLTHATAVTDAVPLIQRFGSTLNLNVHYSNVAFHGEKVCRK